MSYASDVCSRGDDGKPLQRKVSLPQYQRDCPFPIGWDGPEWLVAARVHAAWWYALRRMVQGSTFGVRADAGEGI